MATLLYKPFNMASTRIQVTDTLHFIHVTIYDLLKVAFSYFMYILL